MFNNLDQVTQFLRGEIYGRFPANLSSNKEKFESLMTNLKLHSPGLILDDDWGTHIKPLMEELCAFPNVRIVDQSRFLVYELEDGHIRSTPLTVGNVPIASISGFVSETERLMVTSERTYLFIYYFKNDNGFKTARFTTYTTDNPLIEPNAFKTT